MLIMNSNSHIAVFLIFLFIASNAVYANPNAGIFLSCGNKDGGIDADGRKWEPDLKYLVNSDKSAESNAETKDPSLPSEIPYMKARIFNAETSYKFSVDGRSRVFLRLHFYPSSYPNVDIKNSYFSVVAGGITLLNNFSAETTATALSQGYIIKEYILAPLELDVLNLTFKPSDKYSGSFAFVNGIEVIQTTELFSDTTDMVGFSGDSSVTVDATKSSLETMYRLNVGGQYISPANDSAGLMRSWYDDTAYTLGLANGVTNEANTTIRYDKMTDVIAPLDVYKTARTMGPDPNVNQKFNLTWVFEVDVNFTYLLRFHFCDYIDEKVNQRVFEIYINNQTATGILDIIGLSGSKGRPMTKDFVINVNSKQNSNEIWVALHPNMSSRPEFYDSMLNGLEIFKLGDSKSNLAGPNPTLSDMMLKRQLHNTKDFAAKKSYTTAIIGGAAGGAAAFGVAAAIFFVAYNRKRRVPGTDSVSSWLPIYGHSQTTAGKSTISGKSHGSTTISSDAACNCRYFSLAEIKQATKNFDESHVIGVGGFGKVYSGVIDGDVKVAIKRSNPSSEQGVNEFQTEIEMLSKLRHRHLVSLIGFCEEGNEMALVYDYMGKGTLREHLYKNNKVTLTWKQRLEICIGAARGLHYLHTGAKYTIIHRDVKTTNILLDDKWVAKVSDFGLSKTGPNMNQGQGHVSTVVKGSFGYLDPEYFRRQQLTEKSDVYSFGVVLFEVLCARPALNPSLPKEQVSLADYVIHCQRKGTLEDIIDPHLKGKVSPECLRKFADTAMKCLADHGTDRPSMGDVLWNLEFVLQMESNCSGPKQVPATSGSDGAQQVDHNSLMAMHRSTLSLGSDQDEKEVAEDNTDDIFSQIVNPKGR